MFALLKRLSFFWEELLENTYLSIDFNRKKLNLTRSCRSRT